MVSELTQHRRDFWRHFAERLPDLHRRTVRGNEHSRWLVVGHRPLVIAHYVANRGVGLFVRGLSGEKTWQVRDYLFPHRAFLAARFTEPGLKLGTMFLMPRSVRLNMTDRATWPAATEWFGRQSPFYEAVFAELQLRPAGAGDEPTLADFLGSEDQ